MAKLINLKKRIVYSLKIGLWSLKKEKLEIQNEINDLRNQIAMLEKEEEKLKFDEKYIEKIAREKFKMVKPGERVFKITD